MSEMIVNKLTGKTSAGDIDVVSEGGNATMQLQQGLAKVWAAHVLDAATSQDTLNVSSISDTGSGDNRINLSNNMSYANFSVVSMCSEIGNNTNPRNISLYDTASSTYRIYGTTPSGSSSAIGSHTSVFGDLA